MMKHLWQFFIITLAYFTISCSSGGGDSVAPGETINIEGVWAITETDKSSNCAVPAPPENFNLTVSQDGSSVTVVDQEGNSFSATLNSYNLSWTGSYSDEAPDGTPGTTTLTSMVANIDASCNSLTGTANWSWAATDGSGYTCSGTTTFSGSRTPASGCGITDPADPADPADPTGIWTGSFTEDSFSTDLGGVIVGGQLKFVVGNLDGVLSGTASVSGSNFTGATTDYYNFDMPYGTTNLTGTFTAKSSISGTFSSSDGGTGTFSLAYDSDTDKGSSLSVIAGSWFGSAMSPWVIDSSGVITGADVWGCVYNGTVTIIDPAVNIYGLSITISSCPGGDGSYTGYAVISDSDVGTNDELYVIFNNSSGAATDFLSRFNTAAN